MNKLIATIVLSMILMTSGCQLFPDKPRDVNIVVDKIDTCAKPPKADRIVIRNVDFSIIKDEHGIYWIAVTPRFYENLSINMQEISQHIKQKNAIVKYYESCHTETDEEKPGKSVPNQ